MDVALFNSGSLRSDTIHEKGPLKMKVSVALEYALIREAHHLSLNLWLCPFLLRSVSLCPCIELSLK